MPKTLLINFSANGCTLDLGLSRQGAEGTAQAVMVNVATDAGSDAVFPDRGTSLLADVVAGGAVFGNRAIHIANVAAVETQNFMRLNSADLPAADELARLILQPVTVTNRVLRISATVGLVDGTVIPLNAQL